MCTGRDCVQQLQELKVPQISKIAEVDAICIAGYTSRPMCEGRDTLSPDLDAVHQSPLHSASTSSTCETMDEAEVDAICIAGCTSRPMSEGRDTLSPDLPLHSASTSSTCETTDDDLVVVGRLLQDLTSSATDSFAKTIYDAASSSVRLMES